MSIMEKELANNEYRFWLKKRCTNSGHNFMLRFGAAGIFYECMECGEKISSKEMKEMKMESKCKIVTTQ